MLDRVVRYIDRVMLPVSKFFSSIGMVTMVLLMLVIVIAVCSRRFFNMPIRGIRDLTILGFSIIVFLPMAWCTITDGHVSMSFIIEKFPKPVRSIITAILLFLTTVTMALLTWQLYVYGARVQTTGLTTILLSIPTYPFLYLATLGTLLMTIVFFMKFLLSLNTALRKE